MNHSCKYRFDYTYMHAPINAVNMHDRSNTVIITMHIVHANITNDVQTRTTE